MIKNLKSLRVSKGLSQHQLAEKIGVSQQSINKYENHNVEPDISLLISIAEFFNTSVDYLIGHSEIMHVIENIKPYDLNKEEAKLIDGFRKLSQNEKDSIHLIIKNYCEK